MSKLGFLKESNESIITDIFQKRLTYLDAKRAQRKSVRVGKANKAHNRYSDILPFDDNIVKLQNVYINASYMTSLYGNSKYIMAQGPLPHTVDHFWEMVWNEQCYLVIMLTPEKEGSKIKCHKYWQNGQYGEFGVEVGSECAAPVADTTVRKIKLTRGGSMRIIFQVHFIAWPDHQRSKPEILIELISYCNDIATDLPSCHPVVHCSAGVGRSGTFCAIDAICKDLKANLEYGEFFTGSLGTREEMEILPNDDLIAMTVNHLREQRVYSVQSLAQFNLIYQCLGLMEEI